MINSVDSNTSGNLLNRRVIKYLYSLLLAGVALTASKESAAVPLLYSNVSNSYSNCSYIDYGNGVSGFRVTVGYNPASGHTGGARFLSRGMIIYAYNAQGGLNTSSRVADVVSMRGIQRANSNYQGDDYYIYYDKSGSFWLNQSAFSIDILVNVDNAKIKAWPAIGIRAANVTYNASDVGESAGVAYVGKSTKNGICEVISNPANPPAPVDVALNMTAPDWDLGELIRAEETIKTLSAPNDQLCFSYDGSRFVTFQKYIINATNINGLSDNGRYLLKSLEDNSQTVPYSLTLQSPTDSILLPNTKNTVLTLSNSGRTCFTPTFKTLAAKGVKEGTYSDVLTFTVVAKP